MHGANLPDNTERHVAKRTGGKHNQPKSMSPLQIVEQVAPVAHPLPHLAEMGQTVARRRLVLNPPSLGTPRPPKGLQEA
jgi:hypothetical protein